MSMMRFLNCFSICLIVCVTSTFSSDKVSQNDQKTDGFVRRIADPDLYYAAESRNYPEAPNTLFVTKRGGGVKVFDISESTGELKTVSAWVTDRAVEGQDRVGDLLVVAELGRG
jgi:hypothetical protein